VLWRVGQGGSKAYSLSPATYTRPPGPTAAELLPYVSDDRSARDHLDVLADTIDSLHQLDPNGQIFRYPEWVSAPEKKPRTRRDQPPPFEMVSLRDWASTAEAVFEAAKCFLDCARERATSLAAERGDPPIHFHETVMNLEKR